MTGALVDEWRDMSPNKNVLTASAPGRPTLLDTGWAARHPALSFDGVFSLMTATAGSLVTAHGGTDTPFSVFFAIQLDTSIDHGIMQWDNSGGLAVSQIRIDSAVIEALRYNRVDDLAGAATVTGAADLGTGRQGVIYSFPGTTCSTYVAGSLDLDAGAANVGALTINRFRIGQTTIGQLDGQVAGFTCFDRVLTALERDQLVRWGAGRWGYA